MNIYVPDSKVISEAFEIIDEVYSAEELEKFIMKLLRKYKEHADVDDATWHNLHKYVQKQMDAENKWNEELEALQARGKGKQASDSINLTYNNTHPNSVL